MQHISKQSHKSSAGFPYLRIVALLFSVFWFSLPASAKDSEIREIQLDQDTEISISIFPAKGQYRILWIPAFATPNTTVEQLASQLTALDVEVWHADFLEARFLPKTASSIYKIPEKDIISVINSANKDNNKKLFVFTESRAVIPVLLALRTMQQSSDMLKNFGGVIMNR